MIEDINLKNAEVSAILTMVFDEVQRIYELEKEGREYELDRLKDTLMTSFFMMSERVEDINEIASLIMKKEKPKGAGSE
ncbi:MULTISPECIES: hypothetical protein [unclassified Lactococcus]|uniref:hypothetical protein n=1 Tax=Lactococcus TaxID=1357 RepID=UPI001431CF51|nr:MULTISPECIES: hypothetical protein [unclassified Lactococcus]KAF6607997.1 hypothetical protein HFD74_11085 [Lactococcus sp. EKM201L]KAF6611825.1 hypothetical protein HFD15_10920 [Lactococcus sp. EKM203L]KAF6640312.1 hypothetical protein HFC73_11635 [Lactococcus sp. EKM501L]KAF6642627.1 hypothetical protein HFC72_11350 [Lactococcus sp. EKM502L]KAF6650791.1 hypothetical protein HFC74_12070 [Lactococcus sp. EKM101L]